jgi:hypothetical protein
VLLPDVFDWYRSVRAFPQMFLLVQVGLGFLSDVENRGMYDGEMQDGQPHGNGTIGKENMFKSTKIYYVQVH